MSATITRTKPLTTEVISEVRKKTGVAPRTDGDAKAAMKLQQNNQENTGKIIRNKGK